MLKRTILFSFLIVLLSVAAEAQLASGGGFTLEKAVIAGGGSTASSSGAFTLAGTSGQNASGASSDGSLVTGFGGFWTPPINAPTASGVSINGKVSAADGRGIRGVMITIMSHSGDTRSVMTGSFGTYRFNDIDAGGTYVMSVVAKRFKFAVPTVILNVSQDLANIDFVALP